MSAVAHLLRRRCSSLLQKHHKISSPPSSTVSVQSPKRVPPGVWHRNFSSTTTNGPEVPPVKTSSSGGRALTYTTAGAAVLLLSSAAWYATRGSETQTKRLDSPSNLLAGQDREDGLRAIDEKTSDLLQRHQVQEEATKAAGVDEEATSYGRNDSNEGLPQFTNDGARALLPEQVVEISESLLEKTSPGLPDDTTHIPPPLGPEEDIDHVPPPVEDESTPYEEPDHTSLPPKEPILEYHPASDHEQTVSSDVQVDNQSTLTNLVDAVKDKVSTAKDYLLNETPDLVEDIGGEKGGDDSVDTFEVREILRESYPDMFYPESDDDRDGTQRTDGGYEESQLVEIMGNELVGVESAVPSRLSPSYLVQKGHEDTLRRLSEKKEEGEVPDFVERGRTKGEENDSTQALGKEKGLTEESPKLVEVEVLVGAIQATQQWQKEEDNRTFQEQLHMLQEAHKRELNDFQNKIVAYEEGTEQLESELKKEREGASAALKILQSKSEERLKSELKQKDEAASEEMERLKILEKARAAASLTQEKAQHLADLHLLQLHVDALRTAFYTRSEEARISHTAHKLAMGAFVLEDAIERGQSVEQEADLLIASAGGPGVDPLVDAIVSSLPSEALTVGTGTRAQLHTKFSRLKGSLRELALMPADGGGVFAHFFARLAANVKIREQGSDSARSEGIEAVIGKVEKLLADEKLLEAADVLEIGARGTAAESVAFDWAKQARNRAIIEQGLQVLRAHVIAVASGLS